MSIETDEITGWAALDDRAKAKIAERFFKQEADTLRDMVRDVDAIHDETGVIKSQVMIGLGCDIWKAYQRFRDRAAER